jgi:hypothetical protein
MKLPAIKILLALVALSAIGTCVFVWCANAGAAPQKVILAPKYLPGQVVRYQLETTTSTSAQRGGAIHDPQGASALTITWNAISRMEVLSAGHDASGKPDGSVRLRSTYEKSSATADGSTYDPDEDSVEERYRELQGRSFEFTLAADGQVRDVQGFGELKDTGPDSGADALRAWLGQFASAVGPRGGISVGQTWTTDQPITTAPLTNLAWRTRSTYERNEPCQSGRGSGGAESAAAGETCAVILSKLELTGSRPGHDATPDSYKKRGLRTEGTWTGSGDSLSYVSLATGRLVSVTQTSSEQMDFKVSTTDGETRVAYQGSVQSKSRLALLPGAK